MSPNFCNNNIKNILLIICSFVCVYGDSEISDQLTVSTKNNIFRPSYFGIPRYYFEQTKGPLINEAKRALSLGRSAFRPGKRAVGEYDIGEILDLDELYDEAAAQPQLAKRSIALGREKFRPGKRSLAQYLTADDLERMGISANAFSLLTEAQMGKRSSTDYAFVDSSLKENEQKKLVEELSAMDKRSMAVGRSGFRPGKRSIATGRVGFRPGKRSAFPITEIVEIPTVL